MKLVAFDDRGQFRPRKFKLIRQPQVPIGGAGGHLMSEPFTRVLSDIHYGDRVSGVRSLPPLQPLLEGLAHVVLNGDTIDTRPSEHPEVTAAYRKEIAEFFPAHSPQITYLTGNHDADITTQHYLDLGGGEIFVVHGDVLFPDIVPWSQDAPLIGRLLQEEKSRAPVGAWDDLDEKLKIFRRVAGSMAQRHQAERNAFRYAVQFAADTVWPPTRGWRILQAWRTAPRLAAQFVRKHRPKARIVLTGHTHRPGNLAATRRHLHDQHRLVLPSARRVGCGYPRRKNPRPKNRPPKRRFFPGEILREIPLATG